MNKAELQARTLRYAAEIIRFTDHLSNSRSAGIIRRQLIRSATSVGANYRAACRGKSTADFIAKLGIVLEEVDESLYWLELMIETGLTKKQTAFPLVKEANELTSIIAASLKTSKARQNAAVGTNLKS